MTRRIFSLILAALLLAGMITAATAEEAGGNEYYIYTENGRDLNVRAEPMGDIVGSLKSGTKITVLSFINSNWAMIPFFYDKPGSGTGEWPAYVNRRYLTDKDPAELPSIIEREREAATGDPMTDISAEFASAEDVDNYRVIIRPARVTSWVNMRWIPSEAGMIITQYKANAELIVLKETDHYLQVQDPDTGDVGYIHKKFAARKP